MKTLTIITLFATLTAFQTANAQRLGSRANNSDCRGANCGQTQRTINSSAQVADFCSEQRLKDYMIFVGDLRDFVTPFDYGNKLLPIKTMAKRTMNVLSIYGPYHQETSKAFLNLIDALDKAKPLFDNLITIDAFFQVITDIEYVTMSLERSLYN